MISIAIIRQIQQDQHSLNDYLMGSSPGFAIIKSRMIQNERNFNPRLPDHFYQSLAKNTFANISDLPDLITDGIYNFSSQFLYLNRTQIHVQENNFNQWQNVITQFSPLLAISSILSLSDAFVAINKTPSDLAKFLREWVHPNVSKTALPSPHFIGIESFVKDKGGFHDLHLHLSGITEFDSAIQFFLNNPYIVYKELQTAYSQNDRIREQFEQEQFIKKPFSIYQLLKKANHLRFLITNIIFNNTLYPQYTINASISSVFRNTPDAFYNIPNSNHHPIAILFRHKTNLMTPWSDLCLESLFYALAFREITISKNKPLSELFHCYLLILGSVNRVLVQQLSQNGFDQFQKITINSLRERPDKDYKQRFKQLQGNNRNNCRFFECRFSPKDSAGENYYFANNVINGFYPSSINRRFAADILSKRHIIPKEISKLKLVAHFIKKEEPEIKPPFFKIRIRNSLLRKAVYIKARALARTNKSTRFKKYFTGIDAASNELHTPPEAFAPAYRYLRDNGFKHFTFHVGEDFHHLLSGIRAIYEAVEFLELKNGDRIGHATAAGINPQFWMDAVGEELFIDKLEWLDNLIFSRHFIVDSKIIDLNYLLPSLDSEIIKLGAEMYGRIYSVDSMIKAWLLRQYCPYHLLETLSKKSTFTYSSSVYNKKELLACKNLTLSPDVSELVQMYHRTDLHSKQKTNSIIKTSEIFSPDALFIIQEYILDYLSNREIVIETPLTSNVRICFYRSYAEHHIWRWLNIENENSLGLRKPAIVLGTDDPGIFATNIYNEYSHLFTCLINEKKVPHNNALAVIEQLEKNSSIYRFD